MKKMSLSQAECIKAGECDGFAAFAAISLSSVGFMAYFGGPVLWPGAIILSAAGTFIGTQCHRW
jgi:hypothetical protein